MHHPSDRIAHTTAFVIPVEKHLPEADLGVGGGGGAVP